MSDDEAGEGLEAGRARKQRQGFGQGKASRQVLPLRAGVLFHPRVENPVGKTCCCCCARENFSIHVRGFTLNRVSRPFVANSSWHPPVPPNEQK